MRRRLSCPDCGKTETRYEEFFEMIEAKNCFDCPHCGAHYTEEDFWHEYHEKYSLKMVEEAII